METAPVENSQAPETEIPAAANDVLLHTEQEEPKLLNQGDADTKCEMAEEELRGILEVIASTGKFWHDWDTLKGLLSFRLKQVLADYPEAQVNLDQQSSSLGETFADLVRRLDEALSSFIEGPPFTLQRLCEILLTSRIVYPNLSKLALALEKNLLVTSTLTICTDPYPSSTTQKPEELDKKGALPPAQYLPLQKGVESVIEDEDEEMTDAEEVELEKDGEQQASTEETMSGTEEASSEQNIESTEETMNGTAEAISEQNIESTEEKMTETAEVSSEQNIESTEVTMNETVEASSEKNIESTEETPNGTAEVSSEHVISEPSVELPPSRENENVNPTS